MAPAQRVTAEPASSLRRPSLADIFHICAVAPPRARDDGTRDAGHGSYSDKLLLHPCRLGWSLLTAHWSGIPTRLPSAAIPTPIPKSGGIERLCPLGSRHREPLAPDYWQGRFRCDDQCADAVDARRTMERHHMGGIPSADPQCSRNEIRPTVKSALGDSPLQRAIP